jgi:antirestriction protein ArdC
MASNDRKNEIIGALTEGIAQLTSSQRWQDWLSVQSRFHRYSFRNSLLIQLQCPHASRVAGFRAWQQLGRQVRKGEKAIWILAPVTRKVDADSQETVDTNGQRVLVAFKPACVFDISQTDGDELLEACARLQGDDPTGSYDLLRTVAHGLGYTVEETELPGTTNGDCNFTERRIRVEVRNDGRQQVKTLAHELGHAILHQPGEGRPDSRPLLELEAESVAYVVCHNLGIDTSDYSFGYVATWAGGSDEARDAIKASGSRIQKAADQILTAIEAVRDGAMAEVA